ncbi:MAG: hypothetical protein NTU53_04155 [Planctomycetota bacterium]|nr:hypothetical protein [Planctomycetota bacterium]
MAQKAIAKPAFVEQLVAALMKDLAGAEVDFEHVRDDRYRFRVIWDRFDAMGHPERQRLVWNIAEKVVKPQELLDVGMILTLGREDLPSQ